MHKARLEAFSDGVIAIIITIMVLELKVPHSSELIELQKLIPVFFSYCLSFLYVGIYWNNHHHLFQTVHQVSGKILWANLHLLFWLSLIPFATAWSGENHFENYPVALYGLILMFSGTAYYILSNVIISHQGPESTLKKAIGKDTKGMLSIVIYAAAVPLAFFSTLASMLLYVCVALIWLIPDQRIENKLGKE